MRRRPDPARWVIVGLALFFTVPAGAGGDTATLYDRARQLTEEGQWRAAEEHLWKVIEVENRHAGAWLDLGLLYCERGWRQPASAIFDRIATEFAPSPSILAIVEDTLRFRCGSAEAGWQAAWRVAAGHDSNVNLGLRHERIALADALGTYWLDVAAESRPRAGSWASEEIGLRRNAGGYGLWAQLRSQQYNIGGEYDQLQAGAGGTFEAAGWRQQLAGQTATRGGATESIALSWQGRREMPGLAEWRAALAWGHAPRIAPRDTLLAELGLQREWLPMTRIILGLYGGVSLIAPKSDTAPGGRRTGEVVEAWASGSAEGWEIALRGRWRHWRDEAIYSALLGQKRNQRLGEFSLSLMRVGRDGLRCGIVIDAVSSRDALPLFEYRQKRHGIECGGWF